jgi:transcriptional regulator with XRE-family HTH domain
MSKQTAGSSRSEAQRIGATLRAIREIRGMTVEQLATRELGIAPSHLRNIENGRRSLTAEHLAKAAKVLDVPQIALVREGYFDREAAEREAEVRRLTRERDEALAQIRAMRDQLDELRSAYEALPVPQEVA